MENHHNKNFEITKADNFQTKTLLQQKLLNFTFLDELGRGGMGVVFKVWDHKHKCTVALKALIAKEEMGGKEIIQRFAIETRAIAKLKHAHIVKFIAIGKEQDIHYFTMDYIEGVSLNEFAAKESLSFRKIAILIQKIAKTLDYAHSQGVLHRDLKPSNVLVDKEGEPYIVDFGLAKISQENYHLTKTGQIMGTPVYMSPEQASGKFTDVDKSTDIYSLGAILYELICGQPPFSCSNLVKLLCKIIDEQPVAPRKLNKKIPVPLEKICLKAIAKKKTQRYDCGVKLAEDLDRFLHNEPVIAKGSYQGFFIKKNRYWLMSGLAFLVFLILAMASFFKERDKKPLKIIHTLRKLEKKVILSQDLRYAENMINLNFLQQAKKHLLKALKDPKTDASKANVLLIITMVKLKEYGKAVQKYQDKSYKYHSQLYLAMAKAYLHLGVLQKSQQHLLKILKTSNTNAILKTEVLFYSGKIHVLQQKHIQAVEDFTRAQKHITSHKRNPEFYPMLLLLLGKSYFKLAFLEKQTKKKAEKLSLAIKNLQMAKPYLGNFPELYEYMAKSFFELAEIGVYPAGNFQRAQQNFVICTKLCPQNSLYYALLGKTLQRQKFYQKAHRYIQKSLQLNSGNLQALNTMLELSLKQPYLIYSCSRLFIHYVSASKNIVPQDLFIAELIKSKNNYYQNYLKYLNLQDSKGDPLVFINVLKRKTGKKIYSNAVQGLVSLRYYPNIEKIIQKNIKDAISTVAKKNLEKVFLIILEKKQWEQKYANYYRLLNLKEPHIEKQLKKPELQRTLLKVFYDATENPKMRYLAALGLLKLLDFKTIERGRLSEDITLAIICTCILKQHGFPLRGNVLYKFSSIKFNEFIYALVAQNLDFSAKKGQRLAVENLEKLMNYKSERIKLYAAASLFRLYSYSKDSNPALYKAGKVLQQFMKHAKSTFRSYAHYYYWDAKFIKENFEAHQEYYLLGLQDSSQIVNIMTLKYSDSYALKPFIPYLVKLARRTKGTTTELMAIFALCRTDPFHPELDKIIHDASASSISRIFTLVNSTVSTLFRRGISKEERRSVLASLPKLLKRTYQQLPLIARSNNLSLKMVVYYLSSIVGYPPLEFLEVEKNRDIQAHILMNLHDSFLNFPFIANFFENPPASKAKRIQVIKKYCTYMHQNIRQNAMASLVELSSSALHKDIYVKVTKTPDKVLHQGAAQGFYNTVFYGVMSTTRQGKIFSIAQPEEHYQSYCDKLAKLVQNAKLANKYYENLTFAIRLAPKGRYYYERALIYKARNNTKQAIVDLKKAIEFTPDYARYKVELAQTLSLEKKYREAKKILAKIDTPRYVQTLSNMGDLYLTLGLFKKAQKIFKSLILRQYSEFHLHLARVYAQKGNYPKAMKYLKYMSAMQYKKHIQNPHKHTLLHQSALWAHRELHVLLKDPWVQNLPK